MRIGIKRAYEKPSASDGYRVLVDRVWPRGVTREELSIDAWSKMLAPSTDLRKWFAHDPEKWQEFKRRYFKELDDNGEAVEQLLESVPARRVTLVYSAKEEKFNNAVALKDYLEKHARSAG